MKQEGIEAYMNQERLEVVLKVAIHVTSKVSKYFAEVLSNSLLIPKPKFKVGDKVRDKDFYPYRVNECFYDLIKNEWWYVSRHGERVYESELELVERTEDGNG